ADRAARVERREIERTRLPARVHFTERRARIGAEEVLVVALPDRAAEDAAAERQARHALVVGRAVDRDVARARELQFLMDRAERRDAAFGIGGIPVAKVLARREADVPAEARFGRAEQREAAFAPRRRNDRGLDEIALDAIVVRRLVVLVEEAERNQRQARAERHFRIE